jgi:hypothetical protein
MQKRASGGLTWAQPGHFMGTSLCYKGRPVTCNAAMLIVPEHSDFLGPHPQPLADSEGDVGEQFKDALRKDSALKREYPDHLAVFLETAARVGVPDFFLRKDLEACREMLRDALNEMVLAYRQLEKEIPVHGQIIPFLFKHPRQVKRNTPDAILPTRAAVHGQNDPRLGGPRSPSLSLGGRPSGQSHCRERLAAVGR